MPRARRKAGGPPELVAIDHDDHHAEYVGRTRRGNQFFLTTPFVPGAGTAGREFLALYVFDREGKLVSATIDDFGPRASMDLAARAARRDELLASLGKIEMRRIEIAPFSVKRFGIEFGLIPRAPEEEGEDWCAIFLPGDVMCFWPPWDSGDYDT